MPCPFKKVRKAIVDLKQRTYFQYTVCLCVCISWSKLKDGGMFYELGTVFVWYDSPLNCVENGDYNSSWKHLKK
jgi:hypothetical protein